MLEGLDAVLQTLLAIVDWVLKAAPLGVAALAFVAAAQAGLGAAGALLHYVATGSLFCIVLVIATYPLAIAWGRISPVRFAKAAVRAQVVAFSTQSSVATLPAMIEAAAAMGAPASVSKVVLPLAVSLFRPGSAASGGAPEGAVGDGSGALYVNIESLNAIAVVDLKAHAVTRRYPLSGCDEPTGITYDPVSGVLIAVCRNGVAKLVEAATGQDRGGFPICARADGSLFDLRTRRGFTPCIDGNLTIYNLSASGAASVIQTMKTRQGARTAAYDPASQRLHLPAANVERDAKGRYLRAEKQFEVLVVAPEYATTEADSAP